MVDGKKNFVRKIKQHTENMLKLQTHKLQYADRISTENIFCHLLFPFLNDGL